MKIRLLVAQKYRGKGVAAAMINTATGLAHRLGYVRAYISTNILDDHLKRNGWRLSGEARFMNAEHGSTSVIDLADQGQ